MVTSGSTRKATNGKSAGWWLGLETLEEDPITKGVEGWALYNELWSKLRWTLGTTFHMPYGKSEPWAGDLARKLALVVLANRPEKTKPLI